MANNWYSNDDWYSPLQSVPTVNAVTPKEKKKNKKIFKMDKYYMYNIRRNSICFSFTNI